MDRLDRQLQPTLTRPLIAMAEHPSLIIPRSAVPHILLTLVATFLFTCFYHLALPALLRFLTRPQPAVNPALASQLASLRRHSNTLNSPATFTEWSKVQRQLQRLEKQHEQQQQQQEQSQQHGTSTLLVYAVVYTVMAACVGLLWCTCRSIVLVEVTGSEWLSWTPVRLLLGEVGVVRWSLLCYRAISLIVAPGDSAPRMPLTADAVS